MILYLPPSLEAPLKYQRIDHLSRYISPSRIVLTPQRPTYGEPSTPASLSALHTYLDGITRLTSTLPPHRRIVQPIITPRFVPTCSDELLSALATVAGERDLWVQSHMCESADQMEWVESTRGRKDEEVFDQVSEKRARARARTRIRLSSRLTSSSPVVEYLREPPTANGSCSVGRWRTPATR